jgi:hypothetical protein
LSPQLLDTHPNFTTSLQEEKRPEALDLEASKKFSNLIFKVLYSFSNSCLHELLIMSRAFRFILRISIIKKREIFNIENESDEISEHEKYNNSEPEVDQKSKQ